MLQLRLWCRAVDMLLLSVLAIATMLLIQSVRHWYAQPYGEERIEVLSGEPRVTCATAVPATQVAPPTGQHVSPFESVNIRGQKVCLSDYDDSPIVVVMFLGTECPLVAAYLPRLCMLAEKYGKQGVAFIGIDSNLQDSVSDIEQFVINNGIPFTVLRDEGGEIADQLGAQRTPEVFVLDNERIVRYHGGVDDQSHVSDPGQRGLDQSLLKRAIDDLISKRVVDTAYTALRGCRIGRVIASDDECAVSYTKQIVRILSTHCTTCHRSGQNAPFALTSYSECVGWAPTIAEVVNDGRMPPWHADPRYGQFRNARQLSSGEKSEILRWAAAGAPKGDDRDLPTADDDNSAVHCVPDVVIPMASVPFNIPATGAIDYQYFTVDPGFEEDRWVCEAEVLIGNKRAVHHVLVTAVPPTTTTPMNDEAIPSEFIVAAAPGNDPLTLPPGMAKLIRAGSQLRFEVHYTPIGVASADLTQVALKFMEPSSVTREVGTALLQNTTFTIPPGNDDVKLIAREVLEKDTCILSLFPHAHLRAKSFVVDVEYSDRAREILLNVPRYDFNWQHTYRFDNPKVLPAGSAIRFTAFYDNSERNVANPDPTQSVRWGPQQSDEMMMLYMERTISEGQGRNLNRRRTDKFLERNRLNPGTGGIGLSKVRGALESPDLFDAFAKEIMTVLPQVDGVSTSFVVDNYLVVDFAVFRPMLKHLEGRLIGRQFNTTGLSLPSFAMGGKTVVHQSIANVPGIDFTLLREDFASSMHVPVTLYERPGTLTLLSTEPDAFPRSAVDSIEQSVEAARTHSTSK